MISSFFMADISIHTSREGCDYILDGGWLTVQNFNPHIPWGMWQLPFYTVDSTSWFQSTHPVRDVTWIKRFRQSNECISIHTSREGCDYITGTVQNNTNNFNPHIPWGMWPGCPGGLIWLTHFNPHIPWGMWPRACRVVGLTMQFQSTHPVRDVTIDSGAYTFTNSISIHTSREGCDYTKVKRLKKYYLFQSTHPVRDVT